MDIKIVAKGFSVNECDPGGNIAGLCSDDYIGQTFKDVELLTGEDSWYEDCDTYQAESVERDDEGSYIVELYFPKGACEEL